MVIKVLLISDISNLIYILLLTNLVAAQSVFFIYFYIIYLFLLLCIVSFCLILLFVIEWRLLLSLLSLFL